MELAVPLPRPSRQFLSLSESFSNPHVTLCVVKMGPRATTALPTFTHTATVSRGELLPALRAVQYRNARGDPVTPAIGIRSSMWVPAGSLLLRGEEPHPVKTPAPRYVHCCRQRAPAVRSLRWGTVNSRTCSAAGRIDIALSKRGSAICRPPRGCMGMHGDAAFGPWRMHRLRCLAAGNCSLD